MNAETVAVVATGWMAGRGIIAAFRVPSLRNHLRTLQAELSKRGFSDHWDLKCENCRLKIRNKPHNTCERHTRGLNGIVMIDQVRVWHSDRPKCAAAFATDRDVLATMIGGEK